MITPAVARLIIRHFDSIDDAVSRRLTSKRPWSEPALTSCLCDLLDEDVQQHTTLSYPLVRLNQDLADLDGLHSVTCEIQTHQYDQAVEAWVTHADLGLVIRNEDHILPANSRQVAWLLQAKRIYPDNRNPLVYSESSRVGSRSPQQRERMEQLMQAVGVPFIQYLIYCPRPSQFDQTLDRKLAHIRTQALAGSVFDYTLGLELHEALLQRESSLAAGLIVSNVHDAPRSLGSIHSRMLGTVAPFSWFVTGHFAALPRIENSERWTFSNRLSDSLQSHRRSAASELADTWAHGIVTGQAEAIRNVLQRHIQGPKDEPIQFLPSHTLTITITVGAALGPDSRQFRHE